MSFLCFICSGPFTSPGTSHSLQTTTCGHLVGLSCMERWKVTSYAFDVFKCPNCLKRLRVDDYHPIYGISDETLSPQCDGSFKTILDIGDVTEQYLSGNYKKIPIFLKTLDESIEGNIKFSDVHNGYILIVGVIPSKKNSYEFVKVLSSETGKSYYIKLLEQQPSTIGIFNKCRKDVVQFSIGFKSGYIQITTCSLDLTQVTSNIEYRQTHGKVNSLTFVDKNKIAYSVEKHGVFVSDGVNLKKDTNWTKLKDSERGIVTDLQMFTENILLGLINNSIFVFGKYDDTYVLYHDVDKKIINFTIDISTSILVIFCSEKDVIDGTTTISYFYVFCKIKETTSGRGRISTKNKYSTSTIKIVKMNNYQLGMSTKTGLVIIKDEEKIKIYSFIPNIKKNILEAFHIYNGINCISVEGVDNLSKCLGVYCIDEAQILSSKFFKTKVAVILENKVVVLDFFCPTTDDK